MPHSADSTCLFRKCLLLVIPVLRASARDFMGDSGSLLVSVIPRNYAGSRREKRNKEGTTIQEAAPRLTRVGRQSEDINREMEMWLDGK